MLDKFKPYRLAVSAFVIGVGGLSALDRWHSVLNESVHLVLEHVAMAFVVAGIVGFGYEYSDHVKRLREIVDRLEKSAEQAITNLSAATDAQMRRFTDETARRIDEFVKLLRSEADIALPMAFAKIFADTPPDARLEDRSNDLYGAIKDIRRRKLWIDSISLRFIGEFLDYASRIAKKLASEGIQTGETLTLELPISSLTLADKILADEMRALHAGDAYLVVSDFGSWCWPPELQEEKEASTHQSFALSEFEKATVAAVETYDSERNSGGVIVKRLFCRFNGDRGVSRQEAETVLRLHWAAATQSALQENGLHFYQVGFLHRRAFADLGVEQVHRGMFVHEQQALCFMPTGPRLSEMKLDMVKDVKKRRDEFERLWARALKFEEIQQGPTGNRVITRGVDDILATLGRNWWRREL